MKTLEINREEYLLEHVSHIGIDRIKKCGNDLVRNYYFLCDIHHRQMVCMMLNNKCYTTWIDDKIVKISFDKELLNDMPEIKEYSDKLSEDYVILTIEISNNTQHNINQHIEHYRLINFVRFHDAYKIENDKIRGFQRDYDEGGYYEADDSFRIKINNYEIPNLLDEIFKDDTFFEKTNYKNGCDDIIIYKKDDIRLRTIK